MLPASCVDQHAKLRPPPHYTLRRYCPPTQYKAREIWPSDATLTASSSEPKTLPPAPATPCSCLSAADVCAALRRSKACTASTWSCFSSSVERISAAP